jgi:hypothetical protein
MDKSFGYNPKTSQFRIARHQVGDFGLHLSLIRSFSWGNNFPPELPFFAGKPLPYHYYFDLLVGILEKMGLRIDLAFNGLSIIAFTALLFLIYKLPQVIFSRNAMLGLLSVILFIFNSSLSFIDFFKDKSLSLDLLRDFWFIPDYLHKGPFDGSLISIFFTLNVYLNQRHFIAGLAISLFLVYIVLTKLIKSADLKWSTLILIGVTLGISSRFHTLAFFSTFIVLFFLLVCFRRFSWIFYIFIPALLVFLPYIKVILNQDLSHPFINLGFHSEKPLSLLNFAKYWFLNFGAALFTIPFGVCLSSKTGRKIFFSVLPLFIIGNIFQLGFRIDHNHSLFNFFFIFAKFYSAYFLVKLWDRGVLSKAFSVLLLFLLTASGIINLMAIKNDFRLYVDDAPANKLMQWIKTNTDKNAVFLAPARLYDPVTLSGRRNYLGAGYYLDVLGYNFQERRVLVKNFFEADNTDSLSKIRKEKIKYMVIPLKDLTDFNYKVNTNFLIEKLQIVYQDKDVLVLKL